MTYIWGGNFPEAADLGVKLLGKQTQWWSLSLYKVLYSCGLQNSQNPPFQSFTPIKNSLQTTVVSLKVLGVDALLTLQPSNSSYEGQTQEFGGPFAEH